MWVFEEQMKGKPLTQLINQTHVNVNTSRHRPWRECLCRARRWCCIEGRHCSGRCAPSPVLAQDAGVGEERPGEQTRRNLSSHVNQGCRRAGNQHPKLRNNYSEQTRCAVLSPQWSEYRWYVRWRSCFINGLGWTLTRILPLDTGMYLQEPCVAARSSHAFLLCLQGFGICRVCLYSLLRTLSLTLHFSW